MDKLKIHDKVLPYRAKGTHFLRSDENFARQSFAQEDNHDFSK